MPLTFPQIKVSTIPSDPARKARQKTMYLLLSQGFNEVITYTMISRKSLELSRQENVPAVAIFNPLTQDQEVMRPSMLPGLLSIVLSNINKGQKNLKFFETGKVYTAKGERETLGVIMTGLQVDDWRQVKKETVDYYDLKGALENTLDRMGIDRKKIEFQSIQQSFFEEGQSANVFIGGKKVGVAGKVNEEILDKWGIKQKGVLFAQVDMEDIYRRESVPCRYRSVSEFPAINRDISLAVPRSIATRDIEQAIQKTANAQKQVILAEIRFIEKYEGEKIPREHRGLIFSLTYRSRLARTLRDEEVTEVHDKVCGALVKDLGVIHR